MVGSKSYIVSGQLDAVNKQMNLPPAMTLMWKAIIVSAAIDH